jgi:UDP-N-acetylmuramate: L-alanyl-gamma-D-glutamyl-meso-diaminopimelate ligase
MNLHFIAIGGSVMHGLALSMKRAGHQVSGSDDYVYDPARSRLDAEGLLPAEEGWFPERIHPGLDRVVLGMHAFADNPELARARALGLPVLSYPEFMLEQSRHKQRVVVAGSFGKTTVTSMILHALRAAGRDFDYLVGAEVPGFDLTVRLSEKAPLIVFEGDEYLASREDPRPKFLLYEPHMVCLTGIEWDHINVFPSEELYVSQFEKLVRSLDKAADLVYNEEDPRVKQLVRQFANPETHYLHPYETPSYKLRKGRFEVKLEGERFPVQVIGRHNMSNLAAAWAVCQQLSLSLEQFMGAMATFTGARLRQQVIHQQGGLVLIRDYAHAPAKVRATVEAVREAYPDHALVACLELHTFSSLNKSFLPLYKDSLRQAQHRLVYVNPHAVEQRRMEAISEGEIHQAFGDRSIRYVQRSGDLVKEVKAWKSDKTVVLLMSSGNFDDLDFRLLA